MTPSSVLSTPTGADSADHYNVRGGNACMDYIHRYCYTLRYCVR
jgi:hypothetical protein